MTTERPIDCGAMHGQALLDRNINVFAIHLLLESVTSSRLLDAVPNGVSFTLDDADPRHKQIRLTIERDTGQRPAASIYAEIAAERARQDAEHGGPKHDDTHTVQDWAWFREQRERRVDHFVSPVAARLALVEIAALAVAQIEALDRSVG